MAKKRKSRGCPRCNSSISVVMRVPCSNLAVAIAKCDKCGRSWGIGCVEIDKANISMLQGYANRYRQKWDMYGVI